MSFNGGGTYIGSANQIGSGVIESINIDLGVRNMQVLSDETLASDAATIAATSLPGYHRMQIIYAGTTDQAAAQDVGITFNAHDDYDYELLKGTTNTATAQDYNGQTSIFGGKLTTDSTPAGYYLLDIYQLFEDSKIYFAGYWTQKGTNIWNIAGYCNSFTDDITTITLTPAAGNIEADSRLIVRGLNWE